MKQHASKVLFSLSILSLCVETAPSAVYLRITHCLVWKSVAATHDAEFIECACVVFG